MVLADRLGLFVCDPGNRVFLFYIRNNHPESVRLVIKTFVVIRQITTLSPLNKTPVRRKIKIKKTTGGCMIDNIIEQILAMNEEDTKKVSMFLDNLTSDAQVTNS